MHNNAVLKLFLFRSSYGYIGRLLVQSNEYECIKKNLLLVIKYIMLINIQHMNQKAHIYHKSDGNLKLNTNCF